jgi:hypothetical protein
LLSNVFLIFSSHLLLIWLIAKFKKVRSDHTIK